MWTSMPSSRRSKVVHYSKTRPEGQDQYAITACHKVLWNQLPLDVTAMHAWASMPHSMTCWGSPRLFSELFTLSVSMEKLVFSWGFSPSAPSSGTVGPRPLGYCSVNIWGMFKIRHACERKIIINVCFLAYSWPAILLELLDWSDNTWWVQTVPVIVLRHCSQYLWTGRLWVWISPACHTVTTQSLWWRVCLFLPLRRKSDNCHMCTVPTNTCIYIDLQ